MEAAAVQTPGQGAPGTPQSDDAQRNDNQETKSNGSAEPVEMELKLPTYELSFRSMGKRIGETSLRSGLGTTSKGAFSIRPKSPTGEEPTTPARHNIKTRGVGDAESLKRNAKSLLNKLTIEKFPVLVEKLACLAEQIKTAIEMEEFVALILDKVMREPEFREMYADLWQVLVWRSQLSDEEELKDQTGAKQLNKLNKILLAQIQEQYTKMPRSLRLTPEEAQGMDETEVDISETKRRQQWMGTVNLIGELFKRKLLPIKILQAVVVDLVINNDRPEEHFVECFAQLICTAGYYVDNTPKYQPLLNAWFGRLAELQKKDYSKRLFCVIQEVLELRKSGWRKKVHRDRAKALDELRAQLETEQVLGGSIHAAQFGNIVVVGQRSNLKANTAYYDYMKAQEIQFHNKQSQHAGNPEN